MHRQYNIHKWMDSIFLDGLQQQEEEEESAGQKGWNQWYICSQGTNCVLGKVLSL